MGVSDRPPHKKDREGKHQRLSYNPGKTEALAAKPRIDLANEQGAHDPPLDSDPSAKRPHARPDAPEQRLA